MNTNLRPTNFKNFIGQLRLKNTLKILIESSIKRKKQLDHILLCGPAGLGKTSLARIIAITMTAKIKYAQGNLLEKKSDVLSLFSSITKGDVIFIDEIHGINKHVEELIYSAMEDGVMDVLIGPDGDQRVIRLKIPSFTLIGATTKKGKLSIPLKERFGLTSQLVQYSEKEIALIVENSAQKLKIKINNQSTFLISQHSKRNPRRANTILKRAVDFLTVLKYKEINLDVLQKTFKAIGLYKYGLNDHHLSYLQVLNTKFNNKFVSIETIAGILQDSKEHIESEIEIDLLEHQLIEKNSRGRKITPLGIEYLEQIDFQVII